MCGECQESQNTEKSDAFMVALYKRLLLHYKLRGSQEGHKDIDSSTSAILKSWGQTTPDTGVREVWAPRIRLQWSFPLEEMPGLAGRLHVIMSPKLSPQNTLSTNTSPKSPRTTQALLALFWVTSRHHRLSKMGQWTDFEELVGQHVPEDSIRSVLELWCWQISWRKKNPTCPTSAPFLGIWHIQESAGEIFHGPELSMITR